MTRLTAEQRARAWQVASLLLGYPDEVLLGQRPLLRAALPGLPRTIAAPLAAHLDHLDATPLPALQAYYVATFDLRRRCCLYLSYYAYGDTRKRGLALVRFTHAYRAAGMELADGELPDHLAVVLEFGATADAAGAQRLLTEHRAGLETLRLALHDAASPYAPVLDAVSATLPALGPALGPAFGPGSDDVRAAVARLVAAGPPTEEVGLDPFTPSGALS